MDSNSLYRTFEHTADIGIEVEAPDRAGIFMRSALAMFDLMFGLETIQRKERRLISAEASNLEELLVAWLNEVLYVYAVDRMLFSRFTDARLDGNSFSAWGWGEHLDLEVHSGGMEIKAATYHGLCFKPAGGLWTARVIFDV